MIVDKMTEEKEFNPYILYAIFSSREKHCFAQSPWVSIHFLFLIPSYFRLEKKVSKGGWHKAFLISVLKTWLRLAHHNTDVPTSFPTNKVDFL